MLKILVKQRLSMLLTWFTGSTRKTKKQSKGTAIAFAALMLYAFGALGFLFWHLFDTIALPFHQFGMDWLFFSFSAVMSFGLMFIGSVFSAKAQLYEARDNDLLLSLPIKPRDILLSRLALLFAINFFLDLLVAVPALMVGLREGLLSPVGTVYFAVVFLLLPFLTLAVGALFGWVLSLITAKVQRKSLVTTVLSFAFFGAYMYFSVKMNDILLSVAADPSGLAGSLGAVAPVYWMGTAIAEENLSALLGAVALIIAAFALMYVLLSATFIKTATKSRSTRVKGAKAKVTLGSPKSALFRRELACFLNCPSYIINAGLGSVMALVASVVLLVKKETLMLLLSQVPEMNELFAPIALGILCMMGSMMLYTTPSISLEGKRLWVVQSLPVDTREVLKAKLKLHNVFALPPVVLAELVVLYILRPSVLYTVLALVLPLLFCELIGIFGLIENLRHPSLDWTTETQAVKSGVGVLITMFGAWGILAVPVLIIIFVGPLSINAALIGFTVLVAALCILLYRVLMTWGTKKYSEL